MKDVNPVTDGEILFGYFKDDEVLELVKEIRTPVKDDKFYEENKDALSSRITELLKKSVSPERHIAPYLMDSAGRNYDPDVFMFSESSAISSWYILWHSSFGCVGGALEDVVVCPLVLKEPGEWKDHKANHPFVRGGKYVCDPSMMKGEMLEYHASAVEHGTVLFDGKFDNATCHLSTLSSRLLNPTSTK
jgi:hypothetical protein